MADNPSPDWTCAAVTQQMSDFMHDRLDTERAERIRDHLAACDACGEALASIVADEAARAPDSLPAPPAVPPVDVYKAFLRARRTRFGILWMLVRDGVDAADESAREWARVKRETIRDALDAMVSPRSPAPAVVRTRGAIRTRSAVRTGGVHRVAASTTLSAEVVRSDAMPTGKTEMFDLVEPPHVTRDARFCVRLCGATLEYVGQIAFCTVDLGGDEPVSFTGVLVRGADAGVCDVEIDEPGVATRHGDIPLEYVSLFVTSP